jgi:hypothetical protein
MRFALANHFVLHAQTKYMSGLPPLGCPRLHGGPCEDVTQKHLHHCAGRLADGTGGVATTLNASNVSVLRVAPSGKKVVRGDCPSQRPVIVDLAGRVLWRTGAAAAIALHHTLHLAH